MKRDCEEDDGLPVLRSKLFFRAEVGGNLAEGLSTGTGEPRRSKYAPANARERRIREAANFKAERRGCAPG